MRRRERIWTTVLVAGLTVVCACYLYRWGGNYYIPSHAPLTYSVSHHQDDTLRIAYIGDSWAFLHHRHHCGIDSLIFDSLHIPTKVVSAGASGAPSKIILERMGADGGIRKALDEGPDYCIISAGINDANLKLGKDYYAQHLRLMIRFLLRNHITPVIIEIPDIDLRRQYEQTRFPRQLVRRWSMMVTGCSMDCQEELRQAFDMMLQEEQLQDKVLVLRKADWETADWKYYEEDRLHPNSWGYAVMDTCLSRLIINHLQHSRK